MTKQREMIIHMVDLFSERTGSDISNEYRNRDLNNEEIAKPIIDLIYDILTLPYGEVSDLNEFSELSNEEGLINP